jgi:hypothetical protein
LSQLGIVAGARGDPSEEARLFDELADRFWLHEHGIDDEN